MVRDWSSSASYVWTPLQADPNYSVGVWVRVVGQADHDNASLPFPIEAVPGETQPPQALQITSLTADLPAPQPVETSITFTATATGGDGGLEYRWWVKGAGKWTVAQNWAPSSTFVWTANKKNSKYQIGVWVRAVGDRKYVKATIPFPIEDDSTATETAEPVQITSLTADLPAPQPVGTSITLTVSTTGGEGALEYRWWVRAGENWTMVRDWSSVSSFVWTPATPDPDYRLGVWVREAGREEFEVGSLPFPIEEEAPAVGCGDGVCDENEDHSSCEEDCGTSSCDNPDLIFCEDWEDGDHAGWDWNSNWDYDDDGGVKCGDDLISSGTSAYEGSCAIHLHFDECAEGTTCSGNDDGADAIFPSASIGDQAGPIFARFAVKYSDGYKWNAPGSKVFYLRSDSGGYFSWAVQLGSVPENPSDLFGPGQFYVDLQTHALRLPLNAGTPEERRIVPGHWYEVEIMARPNRHAGQSDGEVKLWINNALVMDYAGLDFRSVALDPGSEINRVWISAYIGGPTRPHPPQDMWYDNISVSITE